MTKQPVKLYVVRHGETIFNVLDRMQGVGDSPLIESGKEEIREIGRHYAARGRNLSPEMRALRNNL